MAIGIAATFGLVLVELPARAGVVVDHTLSGGGTLAGPNFQVTANLGLQVGSNLFFSFSQFNLAQGQSATFSGPGSVGRIISRVTGGQPSSIDGLIASTIQGADFYFINPAGVMFGAHAAIDVPGSFYVSSAHYLTLADGGRFDAANPSASSLTSAPPQAFGFLGGQGSISFQGSQIAMQAGASLSIIGGDVTLDGAQLSVSGGSINIASTDAMDEVSLTNKGFTSASALTGNISLVDGTQVSVGNNGNQPPGPVFVDAGALAVDGSSIQSMNDSNLPAGDIHIDTSVSVNIADSGQINTLTCSSPATCGSGNGAAILVNTAAMQIQSQGQISSITGGSGAGGDISLNVGGLLSIDGSSLVDSIGFGTGKPGNETFSANGIVISNGGTLDTETDGAANGGSISITTGYLDVTTGGFINTATDGFHPLPGTSNSYVSGPFGNAGNITINASGNLLVVGDGSSGLGNTSTVGSFSFTNGNAGSIQIKTPQVKLDAQGSVSSSTVGDGTGDGGNITIDAQDVGLSDGAGILASVFPNDASAAGNAAAGSITINASHSLTLSSGSANSSSRSQINVENLGSGDNAGGELKITTSQLRIDTYSYANADVFGTSHTPGSINIVADNIELAGKISAAGHSTGIGPDVSITANQSMTMLGSSEIYTGPEGTGIIFGNAGRLTISALLLTLDSGATITTATYGAGDGGGLLISGTNFVSSGTITAQSFGTGLPGNITLDFSNNAILSPGALISTQTASANGGNIDITVGHLLYLDQAQITTSAGSGEIGTGDGGNVAIDPQFVALNDSSILANAFGGNGGNISITTNHFVPSSNSVVQASSQVGLNGTINISSPLVDIGQILGRLSADYLDASRLLRHSCASHSGGMSSSFISAGRGGLPEGAESPLYSPMSALLGESSTNLPTTKTITSNLSEAILGEITGAREVPIMFGDTSGCLASS